MWAIIQLKFFPLRYTYSSVEPRLTRTPKENENAVQFKIAVLAYSLSKFYYSLTITSYFGTLQAIAKLLRHSPQKFGLPTENTLLKTIGKL